MGILSPYRVLDLTNERGLLAGKIFADFGADVIQVEPACGSSARKVGPFGEKGPLTGKSLYWEAFSSNKRGIACNFHTPAGRELFLELCSKADFLFESELPGVMKDIGLSFQDIQKVNPKLIYVSITPFGGDGPKAHYVDSDLTLWAAGGALLQNREYNQLPVRVSLPQSYMHASADAAGAALIAHFSRMKTGMGQHVDVSIQQSVAQCTLSTILAAAVGDTDFENSGLEVPDSEKVRFIDQSGSGSRTPNTKWRVKDGYIALNLSMGPATGRFTNNLMAWLYQEGAIDESTASINWTEVPEMLRTEKLNWKEIDRIRGCVAAHLLQYTKKELLEIGLKRKLVVGPVQSFKDLADNEHLKARHFWRDVTAEEGDSLRLPGPFARTSIEAFSFKRLAPSIGEHNHEVLIELLGMPQEEIRYLEEIGVIVNEYSSAGRS